jgi:dTDP-4-dehydrorhamnose reductase
VSTRVLVTGAAGQVGVDLVDALGGRVPSGGTDAFQPDGRPVQRDEFEVIGVNHHELDVTDAALVHRAIATTRPDVVVHLAAYTAVDRAESDAATAASVNDLATGTLSDACAASGAKFITISTDYVFDGRKGAPYVESDTTNPLSVYGRTKRDGERRCRATDTVVRTSWVLGVHGRNVLHVIAQRVRDGQPLRFVSDQVGTPTFSADLARALVSVVRLTPGGVLHVANSGATSWYDIARAMATWCGAPPDAVVPIRTDDLDPAPVATRPSRSDLASTRWSELGLEALPSWRDGLERFVVAAGYQAGAQ